MLMTFRAIPALVYPLLDWFIPESLKVEAETLRRVRIFLVSHLFGPFIGHTISLYVLALNPDPPFAWYLFFGSITLFWLFPVLLRVTACYVPLALLSVQNLIFTILWGCYQYGGLSSPILPWVITVPLLAFFYLGSGRAVQLFVTTIILLNLVLFYALSHGGRSFPVNVPLSSLSGLGIISTICAAVYVSMMALYYASIATSQSALEHEVARRLETAEQLREATREADRANQAKSEFLAKMSHELRTPLNAVIGYSAMLLEDAEACQREQQCQDLMKIQDAGQHLLSLINDLLDLSKLDAGKMDLFVETLDVTALVRDVTTPNFDQIALGGNALKFDFAPEIGTIEGDATKLGQALSNLISNAAKFTRSGLIVVSAARDEHWLTLAVRDNGPGIDPRRIGTLFENFDEDEDSTTSKYGGTGLGLPLSRKLARLMGGDLWVESTLGTGSSFTIRVPIRQCDITATDGDDGPVFVTSRAGSDAAIVLVVDDDPAVLDLTQRALARDGITCVVAASGFEGIELARTLRPRLIFLDAIMPELNGWQVAKALRADPGLARCSIVMLSSDETVGTSRSSDVQGFLVKPLAASAIVQMARRFISAEPKPQSGEVSPQVGSASPLALSA